MVIGYRFFICLICFLAGYAHANTGEETVRLAATGRFDQLETLLEEEAGKRTLNTRDQHALCYAYSKTKRYNKLMPCLEQVERLVSKGDTRTRLFGLDDATPSILLMRAQALLELAQYKEAATTAGTLLKWIADEGSFDRDLEAHAMATMVLASKFTGDIAEAEKWLKKLESLSATYPLFDDCAPEKVFALARSYTALGRFDKTAQVLESDRYFKLRAFLDNLFSGATFQGLSYWMWTELPRGYLLAKARLETGRVDLAKQDLDRLLSIPAVAANGEIYWLMLYDRGRIAEMEGKLDEAIDYYKRAIEIIEQQRSSIQTEVNKIGFVANKQEVYAKLIRVAVAAGKPSEAFVASERSKSRALVDLLANHKNFGADSVEFLAKLEKTENEALVQKGLTAKIVADGGARRSTSILFKDGQERAPELASLVSVSNVSVDIIRRNLHPNETLLEFYGSGDMFFAFMVDATSVSSVMLDAKDLDADVRALRKAMDEQDQVAKPLSKKLFARLLAPLQSTIGGKDLLVVPHGILHYLPFALLHDGNDVLIAKTKLRVLPSASLAHYLQKTSDVAKNNILVFGNPDLGSANLDLPNAELEAQAIAAKLPDSQLYTRQAATETTFKSKAGEYRYLHIASHGQFNADEALKSRLLLAKSEKDDGSLTVSELYELRLRAELVVMSACQTGLAGIANGDDLVGLIRGFMYAGSKNIVASLWEVDDEATSLLMQEFYKGLAAGIHKRQALQAAQNTVRAKFEHPFYWAAFYITGDGI